jgi:hypothetical protein
LFSVSWLSYLSVHLFSPYQFLIQKEVFVLDLIGKLVIVETPETTYSGKLIEIGEEEVYLESEIGWIVVPVERITSIQEKER